MTTASQTPAEPNDFDALVALARQEQRSGRLAEAAAAFRKVVALRPDVAEAYNSLGNVLAGQGQFDEAAAQFERAVALNPGLFQTYNNLGNILREQGKLDQAASRYEQALALRPDYAAAHINLGNVLRDQGKIDQAAAHYSQAIALRPDLAAAYDNLGGVLRQQGKLDAAAAQYERAVALQPGHAAAHSNLGNVLREQGKLDEALARYQRAIAIRPDYAEAYNNLGGVLERQGKLDDAAAQYLRALALKPGLFYAHVNLGRVLQAQGKLDAAVASFQRAIALSSGHVEPAVIPASDLYQVHQRLGDILIEQHKPDQAAASFQRAIALVPDQAEGYSALGNARMEQDESPEAQLAYERALEFDPNMFQAHNGLGCALQDQGMLDRAVASYQRALAINPRFADAHRNLGNALKDLGKFDEAAAAYDQALALQPDYAEAIYNLSELKTFRSGDADLARLEAIAADPGRLPPDKMAYILLALGKAHEDVGNFDRAFECWLQGNALKRRTVNYNEASCQKTFQRVADLFDTSLLDRFGGVGDPSPAPIFIVGMPRSGSTLVEQILASHPQIHAAGELKLLDRLLRGVVDADGRPLPFPQSVAALDADGLRRLGEAYLAGLPTPAGGAIRITDKGPGNFFRVGLLRLILPNARIIHTMRDPVDTCVSCFSKAFVAVPFSYDLAELGCYYRWYHELMEHWRSVLPAGAMLDVAYEDVVDNLEEQARRLIDYCSLPWDDRCLRFHENSRPIATASNVQVRKPLYRSSLARWRRYEAHLQPLLAELKSCRRRDDL